MSSIHNYCSLHPLQICVLQNSYVPRNSNSYQYRVLYWSWYIAHPIVTVSFGSAPSARAHSGLNETFEVLDVCVYTSHQLQGRLRGRSRPVVTVLKLPHFRDHPYPQLAVVKAVPEPLVTLRQVAITLAAIVSQGDVSYQVDVPKRFVCYLMMSKRLLKETKCGNEARPRSTWVVEIVCGSDQFLCFAQRRGHLLFRLNIFAELLGEGCGQAGTRGCHSIVVDDSASLVVWLLVDM
jgi:hypothetical protein